MPPKNIIFIGDTTTEDKKAFEEILMQFEEIVSKVRQLKDSDGVSYYKNLDEELAKLSALFDVIDRDYKTEVDEILRACNAYMMNNSYNRKLREDVAHAHVRLTKFFCEMSEFRDIISKAHILIQEITNLKKEIECQKNQNEKKEDF